jgi:hypothetical protein
MVQVRARHERELKLAGASEVRALVRDAALVRKHRALGQRSSGRAEQKQSRKPYGCLPTKEPQKDDLEQVCYAFHGMTFFVEDLVC